MCWVGSASVVPLRFRASPQVHLDHYVGFPSELNAPDWVNDDRYFVEFFQPRGVIAETFVKLSMSSMNQRDVCSAILWHVLSNTGNSKTFQHEWSNGQELSR